MSDFIDNQSVVGFCADFRLVENFPVDDAEFNQGLVTFVVEAHQPLFNAMDFLLFVLNVLDQFQQCRFRSFNRYQLTTRGQLVEQGRERLEAGRGDHDDVKGRKLCRALFAFAVQYNDIFQLQLAELVHCGIGQGGDLFDTDDLAGDFGQHRTGVAQPCTHMQDPGVVRQSQHTEYLFQYFCGGNTFPRHQRSIFAIDKVLSVNCL